MNKEFFKKVLADTLKEVEQTLGVKGLEYVRNDDAMHNFNVGSNMTSKTREEVLAGFRLKHEISALDIRNDIANGILPTKEKVDEKYNDIINYWILEKASILDKIDKEWYKTHKIQLGELRKEINDRDNTLFNSKSNSPKGQLDKNHILFYCKSNFRCSSQCFQCKQLNL